MGFFQELPVISQVPPEVSYKGPGYKSFGRMGLRTRFYEATFLFEGAL
jgi:hypothetical protein